MNALGPTALRRLGDRSNRPDSFVWRAALGTAAAALFIIGSSTLVAWATGNVELVQIDSALLPIHYNAAFGFLVWSFAYFALVRGWHRLARASAIGLFALSLVFFASHIAPTGLGLDRWLFVPPPSCLPYPHRGMPPPLLVGLALAGTAVWLAARRRAAAIHTLFGTLIGVVLVFGGPTALMAAQTGTAFITSPGLTFLGTLGAAFAGLALLASPFRKGIPSIALGHALPLAVGALGVVGTLALWVGLHTEQNRRLHRQVQFEAAHVHRLVEERLPALGVELADLSRRWVRDDRERMKESVDTYIGQHPGCIGVARVEPNHSVVWIDSGPNPRERTTLADLGLAEPIEAAILEGRVVAIRPPRSSWNGTRVMVIFAPDRRAASRAGGLIAVYRLQEYFATAIDANAASGYAVAIDDEAGEPLFGRNAADRESRDAWSQALPIRFQSFDWRLAVWPTGEMFQRESLALPKLALLIGLLTTALLTLSVHLAQTSRRRTADLEKEIHEREQTQQALKQSEGKYRSLIENLGQGVFLLDREFRYVAANQTICRTLGRPEHAIIGFKDSDLFDANRAEKHREELRTVLTEGKSLESEEEREAEGRRRCIRTVLTPVRDAAGTITGVLGICWDVTEQRQLEAHVHQASKMDGIGQLAGGIAHDFNNLLTAILGNLDLILDEPEASDATRDLAAAAHNAATRAASLTQRLLGFSRRHKLDWISTNANTIAEEVVGLLRRTIDPLVRIETRLAPGLWPVQADPAQINQVLMNLCLNARDAMPDGGRITIETTCVAAADLPPLNGLKNRAGEYVRLRIADTGTGMTEDVKARIYEPFFTTKEVGKGTGLGLPMVFAIVRQHKGWIDCWSEVGRGTRFDIFLPRGEAPRGEASGSLSMVLKRAGKETILVVDDEEMIRKVAVLTLKSQGYSVLEAADGQEAVDVYSREGDRIDLVLLDLTMPILSGHESFRHLIQLNPRVKVVFASGYAEEQLSDLEKELMTGFLKKPYRPNDLIAVVGQALQGPGQGSKTIGRPAARLELTACVKCRDDLFLPASSDDFTEADASGSSSLEHFQFHCDVLDSPTRKRG